ncbi:MAG: hypothetical protein JWQ35_400 [Bacteriovoracaceae bacterium]|nr:hypothetical protein [Bacteriovoracaceae bacterium]
MKKILLTMTLLSAATVWTPTEAGNLKKCGIVVGALAIGGIVGFELTRQKDSPHKPHRDIASRIMDAAIKKTPLSKTLVATKYKNYIDKKEGKFSTDAPEAYWANIIKTAEIRLNKENLKNLPVAPATSDKVAQPITSDHQYDGEDMYSVFGLSELNRFIGKRKVYEKFIQDPARVRIWMDKVLHAPIEVGNQWDETGGVNGEKTYDPVVC